MGSSTKSCSKCKTSSKDSKSSLSRKLLGKSGRDRGSKYKTIRGLGSSRRYERDHRLGGGVGSLYEDRRDTKRRV